MADQAPPPLRTDSTRSPDDLRAIAIFQRFALVGILVYILAFATRYILPPEIYAAIALLRLGLFVVIAVFVFLLAMKLYNVFVAILLALLTLIPLIGLLIILMVNQKASNTLRQHGVEIGFLGARWPTG